MRLTSSLLAMLLALGCAKVRQPEEGSGWNVNSGTHGCAVYHEGDDGVLVVAISKGISMNLAAIIRSAVSVVGSVFGGSQGERDDLEAAEACRAVFEAFYEAQTP